MVQVGNGVLKGKLILQSCWHITEPSKQLCDQQQLGCRREEQKRGRHCWTHGVRGCWGNTSTFIAYSCLDVDKCRFDKCKKHSRVFLNLVNIYFIMPFPVPGLCEELCWSNITMGRFSNQGRNFYSTSILPATRWMYLVQASWWAPEDPLQEKTSTLLQRESWSRICLASWSGIAGLVL